ncbi:MAG: enoyl-CoA hydratase/isomerase family protein [Burkholderiaceae bacterium]|nr:MAG: enoyl-CoA hydratase/isomerase family protein [Burkholderiaceae bacterium]TAM06666.1 MAG: enoyl-CoA hydratase/isomerase family protein [Pusillimonas sp.]
MPNSPENLIISTQSGTQTWRMNFGPVNALRPDFLNQIKRALQSAEAAPEISAIVLSSQLRIFSAGGDAAWMGSVLNERGPDALVNEFNEAMDLFRDVCLSLRRSPLLIVAALNGHTLAGGLELAAACDVRFAADDERLQIGVPEMDLFGVLPSGGGGTQFIARLMGPSRALQFILDAKPVSAKQAYDAGLIDRLCPPDTLLADAEKFARDVAKKAGRIGISAAKKSIFGGSELPLEYAMSLDHAVHWDAMRRGNFRSGAIDFVKRFG